MNILFCLDLTFSRKNGGIATVSLTLKSILEHRGHKCFLLSAKKNREDCSECQYYLPKSTTDFRVEENYIWFCNFIEENHIDIIINQNGTTPFSIWPLEWSKNLPVYKLTVYHSDLSSLWSCHRDNIINSLFVRVFHLELFVNYVWKSLFRLKYRRWLSLQHELSDRIVFLSDKYFAGYEWFSGVNIDKKFVAIYNSIEDRFILESNEIEKEKLVVFVGRLSKEKRLDYLFEVWKKVLDIRSDWKLSIVGDGELKKQYENMVVFNHLKNVSFEGYSDPLKFYKKASVFCLTSSTEGFPLVMIESMSCGCVPLAFNSFACSSDIIDDGVCGYLIKPFNVDIYAKQLSILMDNETLRRRMAKAAIEKSKQFALENIIKQWERLFDEMMF